MDSIKLIEDNSFQNDKKAKLKKAKDFIDDPFSKKLKTRENKSEKPLDVNANTNLYPENSFKFQKPNYKKYTTSNQYKSGYFQEELTGPYFDKNQLKKHK